jgi:hypothetical protein
MNERRFPWRLFWLLLSGGLFGVAAVMPYLFAMFGKTLAHVRIGLPALIALQFVQTAVLLTLAVGFGLLLAHKIGLGAPLLEAWLYKKDLPTQKGTFLLAAGAGTAVGLLIVLLVYFVFLPLIPQLPVTTEAALPLWQRFLACFYGALDEEILMRLFLLSLVLWLVGKVWRNSEGLPATGAFWTVNFVIALLFGLGHLPAARQIMSITPLTTAYILSLNGIAALVFGYLYWKHGLECAMIAHFSADIVLHVLGPMAFSQSTS